MRTTNWKSGSWNFICDVCGFKRKSDDGAERWDGLWVCRPSVNPGCWETRHPQELIRPIADNAKLPWTRPEPADQFISVTFTNSGYCSPTGGYCQADYAEADCAVVGNVNGALIP